MHIRAYYKCKLKQPQAPQQSSPQLFKGKSLKPETNMIFLAIGVFVLVVLEPNFAASTPEPFPLAKPGCPHRCGDVNIPFPFGIGEGCSLNSDFALTCNESFSPPQPYLERVFPITKITMEGQLYTRNWIAKACCDSKGKKDGWNFWMILQKFSISSSLNKFVVVGCDSDGHIQGYGPDSDTDLIQTGCNVICNDITTVRNNSCSGEGCCQVDIPDGIKNINVTAYSFKNHTKVWNFNPCTYAFVVQESEFNFTSDLLNMPEDKEFPVVLEWAIDNSTNEQSKELLSSLCNEDHNSTIIDPENVAGYRCNCTEGYRGNPYLKDGCQDINECKNQQHDCIDSQHCNNLNGTYQCTCPKGQHGDGRKNGKGCTPDQIPHILIIIVTCGVALTFAFITFIYHRIQKRKFDKRKEKFFEVNGGKMLRNLISSDGKRNTTKVRIFKEEALMKATDNFNKSTIVGQGASGNVYKGTIGTKEVVAIKKSKVIDSKQIEEFINEVIILSQINHPNVVKLVGCCLETEVPLLVYEFVEKNTLDYHIVNERSRFPWEARLKIATETAGAIAHMHEARGHIIHRDIKSANILLDKDVTAKVSDFGASRSVPLDQTQLSTMVQGTFGYLDPEHHQTGLLNDKSDIYSFAVVLVELLVRETVVSFKKRKNKNMTHLGLHFKYALKEDRLFDVLDENVRDDEEIRTQIQGVAEVAKKCLSEKNAMRPTMMQVKTWLEESVKDKSFQIVPTDVAAEEDSKPLLGVETDFLECSTSGISFYSLGSQSLQHVPPDGR